MNYTQEDLNSDLRNLIKLGLIEMFVREDDVVAYQITDKAKNMTEDEITKMILGHENK